MKTDSRKQTVEYQDDPISSLAELSEWCGYGVTSLRKFIKIGELKASKPKNKILVKHSDYERFLRGEGKNIS